MAGDRVPFNAIQKAAYTALSGAGLSASVVDWIDDDAGYPLVVLGPLSAEVEQAKGLPVVDAIMPVDVWSDAKGWREAYELMDGATQALTGSVLSLEGGFGAVQGDLLSAEGVVDTDTQDRVVRHGIIRIRWRVIPTS